ncbi:MAG TPA: 5-oxoprolinase subunit PxpA [Polyangiaceae bacterium]|nr:5-oxoprolinase subunit PxpA [Polyangiaceae bacterium]
MSRSLFLNVDLGELPGETEDFYACAHVANVACGGHAGDDASMRRAVERCSAYGTRLGAHPSYPDRAGFGRRRIAMEPDALRATIVEQHDRLAAVARALGQTVQYVKAHGALYHDAGEDERVAGAMVDAVLRSLGADVVLIGPPAGALARAAERAGLGFAPEGFADRAVGPDGVLVPRAEPGALITDPAEAVLRCRELLAAGGVSTLCVHGDTPGGIAIARAVRVELDARALYGSPSPHARPKGEIGRHTR